jgi:hypothetical protein
MDDDHDNTEILATSSHSSDGEEEIEKAVAARLPHDDVIDQELESFLGDMENELDKLIMESKTNPAIPKIPFAEWYENYTKQKSTYSANDGWQMYTSPDGYPYYYNSITNESEWAPYDESGNRSGSLLSGLQNTVETTQDSPISSVAHKTAGRVEAVKEAVATETNRASELLKDLEEVSPSPMKRPVTSIKNITPGKKIKPSHSGLFFLSISTQIALFSLMFSQEIAREIAMVQERKNNPLWESLMRMRTRMKMKIALKWSHLIEEGYLVIWQEQWKVPYPQKEVPWTPSKRQEGAAL